jgi:hypothetical protein
MEFEKTVVVAHANIDDNVDEDIAYYLIAFCCYFDDDDVMLITGLTWS